jgi:hypothetical protein
LFSKVPKSTPCNPVYSMKSWKSAERRIAAILGGERLPVSGRGRGDAPDIDHPVLSVEVKSRATIPRWLTDALEQAESASRDGRMPAAVLHPDRGRYADALVICRLSEFAQLAEAVDFLEFLDTKKKRPKHGRPTCRYDRYNHLETIGREHRGSAR